MADRKSFQRNLIRLAMQKRAALSSIDERYIDALQRVTVPWEKAVDDAFAHSLGYRESEKGQEEMYVELVRDMLQNHFVEELEWRINRLNKRLKDLQRYR